MNKDNNNSRNNSCNNNEHDNNNEYHIKLYNSVFNNIVIKRKIFHHLNIFNILSPVSIEFDSIKELNQYKYKDYLDRVEISLDFNTYDLNQLPDNIRHIAIPSPFTVIEINDIINIIPHQLESLEIMTRYFAMPKSIYNNNNNKNKNNKNNNNNQGIKSTLNLKSLKIDEITIEYIKSIPPSITSLTISGPTNMKLINSKSQEKVSIYNGRLPKSLTEIIFTEPENPLIINQLSSYGLVKLDIGCTMDIGSNIKFPNTLQHLNINSCSSFNAALPSGLKSFNICMGRYEYEIQFPSSLEHLSFVYLSIILKQEVFKSRHSVPVNLKSLKIQCKSIVDSNGHSIFPDSLKSLNILCFNQVIKENQLPSSLTHLKLNSNFQQAIDINALPSSLNTLELPDNYSNLINPLAIPSNLQLLVVNNYNHPINLTPSSHPNTLVGCRNLKLYYDPSNTDIKVLKLPDQFNSPLSTLQLQDKCNLNYLHLGCSFNLPIQLSDLPINNQIKTLELSFGFSYTINLEHFQNLESIIVHSGFTGYSLNKISPVTTTINYNGTYNYYNLKDIQVSDQNSRFMKLLDLHYYKFIKLYKSPINK